VSQSSEFATKTDFWMIFQTKCSFQWSRSNTREIPSSLKTTTEWGVFLHLLQQFSRPPRCYHWKIGLWSSLFILFSISQECFKRYGGTIHDGEPVLQVIPGDVVTVKTSKSSYQASHVIITVGPWAPKFLSSLGLHLPMKVPFSWTTMILKAQFDPFIRLPKSLHKILYLF
jgi:hypothetical protein